MQRRRVRAVRALSARSADVPIGALVEGAAGHCHRVRITTQTTTNDSHATTVHTATIVSLAPSVIYAVTRSFGCSLIVMENWLCTVLPA
jgi:hypothetical protein